MTDLSADSDQKVTEEQRKKYSDLVDFFGNQSKAAIAIKVKQPSVWAWVHGKKHMSIENALEAQKATAGEFQAVDLCPILRKVSAMALQ